MWRGNTTQQEIKRCAHRFQDSLHGHHFYNAIAAISRNESRKNTIGNAQKRKYERLCNKLPDDLHIDTYNANVFSPLYISYKLKSEKLGKNPNGRLATELE
jgi:hypothetical protein